MTTLAILIGSFWFMVIFWTMYLAAMNLKRVKDINPDNITTTAKVLGYPMVAVGLTIDWLFNLIIGTILFLSLPDTFFEVFTGRLIRHHDDTNFRGKISRWFAHELLDVYDPDGGVHVPGKGH